MKSKIIHSLLSLAVVSALIASSSRADAQGSVYLDTDFSNNNNALPDNSTWYRNSGNDSNFNVGGGALTFQPGSNNAREALTYITAPGSKINVSQGMTLTLSFTFSGTGLVSGGNGFRIGLFDSGSATRIDEQGYGTNTPLLEGYTGYALMTNLVGGNNTASSVRARNPENTPTTQGQIISQSGMFDSITASTHDGPKLSANPTNVSGSFSITNNGDAGVVISYSIGSIVHTFTDTGWKYISFDSIGLAFRGDHGESITFSDMKVELTQIPEAGTMALALGGAGLLTAVLMRRRNKRS